MAGRLIVALLVIISATFVMLQKRETESTGIEANISDTRARQAALRAAELERQIAELRAQVTALEDKVAWQDGHLNALAEDCTPSEPEQPQVFVAKLQQLPARPMGGWSIGQRFALLLGGDPATITRVRLHTSLDDGTTVDALAACDTMGGGGRLLGVIAGSELVVSGSGPQQIAKKRGYTSFELVCDAHLDAAQPLSVEVLLAGGAVARRTVTASVDKASAAPRARP